MSIESLITVVSVRGINPRSAQANLIYIGRSCAGWRQSPLANPFKLDHKGQRTWVILQYTEWLRGKIKAGDSAIAAELSRIANMVQRGETVQLGCWCGPSKACHGDIVKAAVLWWIANKSEVTA